MTCPHHCLACRLARRKNRWLCRFHWFRFAAWLRRTGNWHEWAFATYHWPRVLRKYRLYVAWRRQTRTP